MVESTGGLVAGAAVERLGGHGQVVAGFLGRAQAIPRHCAVLQLPSQVFATLAAVPLSTLLAARQPESAPGPQEDEKLSAGIGLEHDSSTVATRGAPLIFRDSGASATESSRGHCAGPMAGCAVEHSTEDGIGAPSFGRENGPPQGSATLSQSASVVDDVGHSRGITPGNPGREQPIPTCGFVLRPEIAAAARHGFDSCLLAFPQVCLQLGPASIGPSGNSWQDYVLL